MANPPPPYSDITGISRTVMKNNAQESITNYNGNARPGEMVVDLTNNNVYIGNTNGNLNLLVIGGGSGNSEPAGPVGSVQFNAGGNLFGGTSNVTVSEDGLTVTGTLGTGNIIPSSDNVSFLGNSTNRWANIWLGPGTLYITDSNIASGRTAELTVLDGVLQVNGADQLQVGQLKFVDNTIESTTGNIDIEIGDTVSTANLVLNRNTVIALGKSLTFSDGTTQSTAAIPLVQKGAGLGVATLDVGGQLTPDQIPSSLLGGVVYKGGWNADTNTPTLVDGTGTTGWEYSITVTGTQDLGSGSETYDAGGFVIYNGSVWQYVPPVSNFTSLTANTHLSVNAPTGAITISTDATPNNTATAIVSRDVNGSFAANIITANLIGAASSATIAGSATTAGTVTVNSQPNITSVGTLSSLGVSGNITAGNVSSGIIKANSFVANAGTTTAASLKLTTGTLLTTPEAGAIEFASGVMYATPNQTTRGMIESKMMYYNTAQVALVNNTTQQSIFGLTNGVAVSYATRYRFKIVFTVRTTADNVNLFFAMAGTATYFRGNYHATVGKGIYGPGMMPTTVVEVYSNNDSQTRNTINISQGLVGGTYFQATVEGFVDTQYSGYVNPVVALSPAPGATSFIDSKSYMEIYPVGPAASSNADTVIGNWS